MSGGLGRSGIGSEGSGAGFSRGRDSELFNSRDAKAAREWKNEASNNLLSGRESIEEEGVIGRMDGRW